MKVLFDFFQWAWELFQTWAPAIIWHVLPSFVTLCFGGYILQRYFANKSNQATLVDGIGEQMEKIQEDALEYWNLEVTDKEKESRATVLEQRIKGFLGGLSADVDFFVFKHGGKSLLRALVDELHVKCSGGDFESKQRKVDSGRYIHIVNAACNLRSALLRNKL